MAATLPSTMRAVQWTTTKGGLEKNCTLATSVPLPKSCTNLPANSTLVKVAYTTLNPVDYKLTEIPLVSRFMFSRPAIPCMDFSGVVVSTTRPDLHAGQRVCGKTEIPACGALSEYVVVPGTEGCVAVPDNVKLADAAAIGICGLTAYQCIVPAVKPGGKVFINGGSGGTGTFGIQIAKALGCIVTTTCSGPNVELCRSLGADEVLDYRSVDVVSQLKRSGTQYDVVVDNVCVRDIYQNAHHYLKPDGKYVTITASTTLSGIRDFFGIFLLPTFLGGGKRAPKFVSLVTKASDFAKIVEWMSEGKVRTVAEKTYEMEEAGEAFARMKSGRVRGKLIVKVGGE